jgi:hypothetical protein
MMVRKRHDQQQQQQVHAAVDAQRRVGRRVARRHAVLTELAAVQQPEDRQQAGAQEGGFRQQVAHSPEEVHALQEAKEQRWIAQRRERAAGVGDDEDEEHEHMRRAAPVVVGANQRAQHQDRRAGRAHEAGQQRADRHQRHVQARAAVQVAAQVDAAGHRVQRRQQDDERQVVGQQRMHELRAGRGRAEDRAKRQQEGQRPAGRDLAEVRMPQRRQQQRHQRDAEQHAGERHGPPAAELAAIEIRRRGKTWHRGAQQPGRLREPAPIHGSA